MRIKLANRLILKLANETYELPKLCKLRKTLTLRGQDFFKAATTLCFLTR